MANLELIEIGKDSFKNFLKTDRYSDEALSLIHEHLESTSEAIGLDILLDKQQLERAWAELDKDDIKVFHDIAETENTDTYIRARTTVLGVTSEGKYVFRCFDKEEK